MSKEIEILCTINFTVIVLCEHYRKLTHSLELDDETKSLPKKAFYKYVMCLCYKK